MNRKDLALTLRDIQTTGPHPVRLADHSTQALHGEG